MCSALRTATMQCAEGFCEEGKAWGGQVHLVCVCVCVCAFGSKSTPTVSPSHTHTHTHTHINGLYEVESKYSVSQHGYANCRQRDHLVTDECTHNTTFASSGLTLIVVHCPKKNAKSRPNCYGPCFIPSKYLPWNQIHFSHWAIHCW